MATQTELLPQRFHLDAKSREAGRRGLVKARAALAEVQQKNATQRRSAIDTDHATAA